jgi:lipopolysaccharide export system protein LptC
MTVEANVVPGGERYVIRTADERRRAFASANRHTRIVTALRKGLPIFALLVLATYFISSRLAVGVSIGDMTASVEGIEVTDGNLRMTNPKLEGADKKNGKYVIGAEYADQDIKNPNMIKLHAMKADLAAADGGWSRMKAERGVFDNKTGRLVMRDKITVATSSGVSGELKHASLDTKNQVLRSHLPVSFVLPNGTVKANALTFYSAKNTLTFRGKVAVHIVRPEKQTKPESEARPAPAREASTLPETSGAATPPLPALPETGAAVPPLPPLPETDAAVPPLPPMPDAGASVPALPPMPDATGALPQNGGTAASVP